MASMASEDIAKLAETLAKTQVAGGQLSFKGKSLKLNTAEDGEFLLGLAPSEERECANDHLLLLGFGLVELHYHVVCPSSSVRYLWAHPTVRLRDDVSTARIDFPAGGHVFGGHPCW